MGITGFKCDNIHTIVVYNESVFTRIMLIIPKPHYSPTIETALRGAMRERGAKA